MLFFVVSRILESGPGQYGGRRSRASMIFLASIHGSLSVISLRPRSKALSLMVMTAGDGVSGVGGGADGSEDESPRTEIADPVLGCARGTKTGSGDLVVEMPRMSSGTWDASPMPPMECNPATKTPPPTDPLPLWVSGDIPPWLPL